MASFSWRSRGGADGAQLDSYQGVAVRILQSNNAGTTHHIIDPTTQKVVGVIHGCPHAHNITTHPDGLYYYCANEQESTVDVFDTKTLQKVTSIKLSARPNKIAVNKKYRKIYAAIARPAPGAQKHVVDVIDIDTHKLVRSIPVNSTVHNTYVTPDDNFLVAGLSGEIGPDDPAIQVIDAKTDTVAWGMQLKGHKQYGQDYHEVRPMAFEANADGSTKRMFAQATGINAVWVIDWKTRKVVQMLWPPELPAWKKNADGIQSGDMHGVEVLPDRSAVWASSRLDSRIYGWTLPDLKYIGAVEVGPTANWMTPTPDSKYMYVAISGRRLHRRRRSAEARGRRQDQDGRAAGAYRHRDSPAGPRQHSPGDQRHPARRRGVGTYEDRKARHLG